MQVKAREYYGQTITVVLLFEQASDTEEYNSLLYNLKIGTGEIGKLEIGEMKQIEGGAKPDI